MNEKPLEQLSPIIMAMDTSDLDEARRLADRVRPHVDIVKVGLQLYSTFGVKAVEVLKRDGFHIFLDLKLMDIPNTVSSACLALCEHEPLLITLHTMGGQEMMRAAAIAVRDNCRQEGTRKPVLIGVTVLTSLDLLALRKIGVADTVEDQVIRLAKLARDSNLDGLVSSPLETKLVRREVGAGMILVTPGVRLAGTSQDDQKRVATPGDAMRDGADFIVVGRPLYRAQDPAEVAVRMLEEIQVAQGGQKEAADG